MNGLELEQKERLPVHDKDHERKKEAENERQDFENLMGAIYHGGKFQRRFNILYNLVFVTLVSMPYMNLVLALSTQDHWCSVPGREFTNYTQDEWRNLTIPRQNNKNVLFPYEHCVQYNVSVSKLQGNLTNYGAIIPCQDGWDYDFTWYKSTAPSDQNWVCENELRVANTLSMSKMGDVIGTFIFGQLGDMIGRRPVFFATLLILVIGRTLSAFTSHNYFWFLVSVVIGTMTNSAVYQSPLIVAMEVSSDSDRGWIAMTQCLGWTVGMCILPLVYWACGDWVPYMLMTTLPAGIFLFSFNYFIESPRWLATKGRVKDCIKILKKIAFYNRCEVPVDAEKILEKIAGHKEKVYGFASLFSSWRLAKNTFIILFTWITSSLAYYTLWLNINSLAGNPFMNFFWQGLIELPAYLAGGYLGDKFGRRWVQCASFIVVSISNLAMMFYITNPNDGYTITFLATLTKFGITITFYIVYLQAIEVYPTCVRQTGTGIGALGASGLSTLGPYIVYLGTVYNIKIPYIIMGILNLLAAISATFLPETLHEKLPESLNDAQDFGKEQKYWSYPKKTVNLKSHEETC